jgi:hypothetical protein
MAHYPNMKGKSNEECLEIILERYSTDTVGNELNHTFYASNVVSQFVLVCIRIAFLKICHEVTKIISLKA